MKVIATREEFIELVEKTDKNTLIIIDFYADWCGPCKMIAPKLEELSTTYTNVIFCKVNVDDNEDTAETCEIKAMPTFLFYKGGKKIDSLTGANETAIQDKLKEHM